ncbi:MAG: homoserine kinase [Synechococcales bacterium]|nr:homoserine kinase [Synechococcales bacterium]
MSTVSDVRVTVPATTANIGPGFDCLGAALSLYNQLRFTRTEADTPVVITVSGQDADRVSTDTNNLAYQSFCRLYRHIDQAPPAVELAIELDVPLARGLGSSATAIAGGLLGANALAGSPLDPAEVMDLAIAIEGHPDNVVPALLGGCQLTVQAGDRYQTCEIPWHSNIIPVVAIPNFELSTAAARRVLPQSYSRADAIFNAAHLGLLVRALDTGRTDWLQTALGDRIHQPYRQSLIRGYEAVRTAALEAGAAGLVISGAGPTLLALADPNRVEAVAAAMTLAWKEEGVECQTLTPRLDTQGAIATICNVA